MISNIFKLLLLKPIWIDIMILGDKYMKNHEEKLITTVTLNPAIDIAYVIDKLCLGNIRE